MVPDNSQTKKPDPGFAKLLGVIFLITLASFWYLNLDFNREIKMLTESVSGEGVSPRRAFIEIDFGNGTRRLFTSEVVGSYPLHMTLTHSIAKEGRLDIKLGENRIEKIGDFEAGVKKWRIYRNGKPVTENLQQLRVSGGDKYTLSFER